MAIEELDDDDSDVIDGEFEITGVSQTGLFLKFMSAYGKLAGSKYMPSQRVCDAIIEAATLVNNAHDENERQEKIDADNEKLMTEKPDEWLSVSLYERVHAWCMSNHRGQSSEYACYHLNSTNPPARLSSDCNGLPPRPHDPDDFGRLLTLFRYCPELRAKFLGPNELLTKSKAWRTVHVRFAEWESLYYSGDTGKQLLYDSMRVLEQDDEIDRADLKREAASAAT